MRAQRAAAVGSAAGPQMAATMSLRHGVALVDGRVVDGRSQVVRGDRSLTSAALAARLAADPEVEYAVPDRRKRVAAVPNDPLFAASASISPAAGQWYLRAPDATFVSAISNVKTPHTPRPRVCTSSMMRVALILSNAKIRSSTSTTNSIGV